MRELSLHILDIVTNSIEAGATRVLIFIEELLSRNTLRLVVSDNGRGMSQQLVDRVIDPFTTSRSTRPVGMGLPLLNQAALRCDGSMKIDSQPGRGTRVQATFRLNHLNRAPLGDMAGTVVNLIIGAQQVHFCYCHTTDAGRLFFDSYWMYGRMAEQEASLYSLVEPAKTQILADLKRIGSRA